MCGPYVATLLDRTPRFERYIAQIGVQNGRSTTCIYDAVGLYAHNILDTIPSSMVNANMMAHVINQRER